MPKSHAILWQDTGIGKTVNAYRKHCSQIVGNLARHLVTKWKQLVQLTTEVVSETQCAASAGNDPLITADTGKKVVISKVDNHHFETSSSKHKHLNANSNEAASNHRSSAVKSSKMDKQHDDKISISQCSRSKAFAASPTLLDSDQSGCNISSSHNHSASQASAYVNETTESAGGLPLLNSSADVCDKFHHEKHHKPSKHTADDKNKEKYNSNSKLPINVSKSATHRESRFSRRTDLDGCNADKMLCKSGKQFVAEDYADTSLRKSATKDVSKTQCTAGHKGSEKKSLNTSVSDRDSHSLASVSAGDRTHNSSHMSKHQNYADDKTFTMADELDDGDSKGMTFEQMLNYDSHCAVSRKKKQSVHGDGKHSKEHKLASGGSSHASSSITKHSNKPDSRLVSKSVSCALKTYSNSLTAGNGELEMSELNQLPMIPHPDSQVIVC